MFGLERIKVMYVSEDGQVLADSDDTWDIEILPDGFRCIYDIPGGPVVLGNRMTVKVRGKRKNFRRQPQEGEDLIAVVAVRHGRPEAVRWNFADAYDEVVRRNTRPPFEFREGPCVDLDPEYRRHNRRTDLPTGLTLLENSLTAG